MAHSSNVITNDTIDHKNESGSELPTDPEKLDVAPEDRLTKWSKEPSIQDLKGDLEFARPENKDQAANVDGWLALRNATGKESGNKTNKVGRSKVQPKLIRKHNEWRYPALSEPFLDTDRMYELKPRTAADVAATRQNQLLLNWQFDTKLSKVSFIDRYVRTTVDEGTCVLRVGWERKVEKVLVDAPVYSYSEINPENEELLASLQAAGELLQNEDPRFYNLPEDIQAAVEYTIENGTPVTAEETGTEQGYENKITVNQPSIRIINIRNFFIDPSCDGVWEDAQFMIYTYEATESDIRKRKSFKNLDKVQWRANAVKSKLGDPDHTSNTPEADTRVNTDKQKILVYEYWGLFDIHGDGEMVPILVSFIGDTIIQMTENPFPDRKAPFVVVPYMPILESAFGEADASILQDNQRVLGAVSRGMIDLLGRSANGQTGYAKGFLDPVNKRRFTSGEDFEYNPNSDPKVAVQQMTYSEIPTSALQMSQLQNAEAEGLSGVKSFAGGITGDAFGSVARGINGALDAAGQREISILRRLAEGMKHIGEKIISMNQKFLTDEEVVRVTDEEFVTVRRDELEGKFDMKVAISTAAADEAKAQDLGFILQTQGPNADPGMNAVILSEIADLKRMPHLAEKIRAYRPEPDPQQVRLAEIAIEQAQAELDLEKAKVAKTVAEAEKIGMETQQNLTGENHKRGIEASAAQARGNQDLEVTKGILGGETPSGLISAAVGFNELSNRGDDAVPEQIPAIDAQPAAQPQADFLPDVPQEPLALPQ